MEKPWWNQIFDRIRSANNRKEGDEMDAGEYRYNYVTRRIWCSIQNQKIYGVAYIPRKAGKVPLVIFAHELCSTHASGVSYAKALALRGIAAYVFDFRGGSSYSRSDGKTTEMSVMTEADDLAAVTEAAEKWEFADPNRIVLMGASQGGMAAAVEAAREPDRFAGLIHLYPAFVVPDEVHRQFRKLEDVPDRFNFLGWIRVGKNYVSDVWDYDLFGEMKKYQKPVLILHGDRDYTVDCSYSVRAASCYPDAELHIMEGAGHGVWGESFHEAMEYVFKYLKQIQIS